MQKIVLASGNAGKLKEFNQLLAGLNWIVQPQSEYQVPEAIEDGLSFVENAIIKARNACAHTGLPAIADDSGIEVDALNGEPGIYSARYAGNNADDNKNNAALIKALDGVEDSLRLARYQCLLVYMRNAKDPTPIICQGSWEGVILNEYRGTGGFGYDPLFWIESLQCTAAELDKETKNRISHRGKAMQALLIKLQQNI